MHKVKSHKTVEQIAKKHRLDVSFIQKQLDMGVPIEHEHTKDRDLATDIALQHLDEIPDYYTRLKKMESDAKKHHKKFKDIKEYALGDAALADTDSPVHMHAINGVHVDYEKRYCPKCKKVERKAECKYGERYWLLFSLPEKLKEGNLHKWYQDSESKDKKPGWVNVVTGGTCASDKPGEGVPKCVSSEKRASMTQAQRLSAARRKKEEDPGQQEKTGAAKPTYVPTDKPKRKMNEESDIKGKGSGKKDACYHKVKSKYRVFPSAYASGALVQCRKVGAANWGTKSEATMHEEERYCPLCNKRETRSECSFGEKAWDKVSVKDEEYSMVRSELKTVMNAAKRLNAKVKTGEGNIEAWVQSKITKAADYLDTAADYIDSGEMQEQKLVDKILEDCGCSHSPKKSKTKKVVVPEETISIEDADGNTFAEVVDLIKPEPIKGFKSQVNEATRMQAQTGNVVAVTLSWRGKYYSLKMFFPQTKLPSRKDINDEMQKVYPGSVVIYHSVSEIQPGQPLIQMCGPKGGSAAKPGPNRNYIKPMGEEVEIDEAVRLDKSKMKCNKPKAQAVGDSLTGKSHVVKACSGGKEKIIRFGQRGVKGSPKKKGESKAYASRRHRFHSRHAKNIAKGPMSAAYWANKVKW